MDEKADTQAELSICVEGKRKAQSIFRKALHFMQENQAKEKREKSAAYPWIWAEPQTSKRAMIRLKVE